jgi:ribosomal protein S18 acetylase RimI-like enzyme
MPTGFDYQRLSMWGSTRNDEGPAFGKGSGSKRQSWRLTTRLQPPHAAHYRSLMLQAYEMAADAFTSTVQERAAEPASYWVRRIADPAGSSLALGAVDGQALVGTVALECSTQPKTRHKALVIGMDTVPAARGGGVGRALLESLVDIALARDGLRVLTLAVTEGNEPALGLYRHLGFQTIGVEPMAIHTSTGLRAKVHMWLPLPESP